MLLLNGYACDIVPRSLVLLQVVYLATWSRDTPMSNIKQNKTISSERRDYREHLSRVNSNGQERPASAPANASGSKRSVDSWDAYRNWLTKVQAPEQRRSLAGPALFSWKGYRSWAEKVRRDWETEELTKD
jgi:hypothetical protein